LSPLKLTLEEQKMSQKFTEGFKIQAVEKALNRSPEITLVELAQTLGVSRSALQRWITQSRDHQLELISSKDPFPLLDTVS
jgi:transposase-like protein